MIMTISESKQRKLQNASEATHTHISLLTSSGCQSIRQAGGTWHLTQWNIDAWSSECRAHKLTRWGASYRCVSTDSMVVKVELTGFWFPQLPWRLSLESPGSGFHSGHWTKTKRGEEGWRGGVQWNYLAGSLVKLSQSHLLWSTSTWCNHQNAAGEHQSQKDHWQNWGRSAETPHFTNYTHLSLFISVSVSLQPAATQLWPFGIREAGRRRL